MATSSGAAHHFSYASTAGAARRPKTAFGLALATGRRDTESKHGSAFQAHGGAAARGRALSALGSRNSTPSQAGSRQRSRHTPGNSSLLVNQQSLDDADVLDESAAALLSELQQAVVSVSRHMVGERHRAAGQREQIAALKAVVAEQDTMLSSLRAEHEAVQRERGELLSQYQLTLRTRAASRPASPTPAADRAYTRRTRTISAAEVDRCIRAEFCRSAAAYESAPSRAFDEASPAVATVLRALATQLLELRLATSNTSAVGSTPQTSPAEHGARPSTVVSNSPPPPATHPNVGNAPPAPRQVVAASSAAHASGGPARQRPAEGARFYSPQDPPLDSAAARVTNPDAAAEAAQPSRARTADRGASEASESVSSSIYDDAASILSDIRARYGLE